MRGGAEADLAGPGERRVLALQNTAVVDVNLEATATRRDLQDAPGVGGYFVARGRRDWGGLSVLDANQRHRVACRADQIVIALVTITPDEPAPLVVGAGRRLHADAHLAVAEGDAVEDGEREAVGGQIGGHLGEDVGLGGRGLVLLDFPT